MIPLTVRTDHSFRNCYGTISNVIARLSELGVSSAGICDRNGCWGHVKWQKGCRAAGIKPIFGAEFSVVADADAREKQPTALMPVVAKNNAGLVEIYNLVAIATEKFYYTARLDYNILATTTDNVIICSGVNTDWERFATLMASHKNCYVDITTADNMAAYHFCQQHGAPPLATFRNNFIRPDDRDAYEMICISRNVENNTGAQHIIGEGEWRLAQDDLPEEFVQQAIDNTAAVDGMIDNIELPKAHLVSPDREGKTLYDLCVEGAAERNLDLTQEVYALRLKRELDLIADKQYEDYFYLVGGSVSVGKATHVGGTSTRQQLRQFGVLSA